MANPTLANVKRRSGVAGQFSVTADVTYPGEPTERIEFVGSTYGGPVVMVTPAGTQTFVSDPGRFGEFGPEWVRRFFAACPTEGCVYREGHDLSVFPHRVERQIQL